MSKGEALKILQAKIGVTPDGAFGPNTARAIAKHYDLEPVRGAHFLGQAAHESGNFMLSEEGLSYSVESMMRVWPSRFKTEADARPYARNPEALANKTYGGRMGNVEAGDGYKYRGRGFIQLTGRSNYTAFAHDTGRDSVIANPDIVATELAMESALWFFEKNGLWQIIDNGGVNEETIKTITKRINGGHHGLSDRMEKTNKIYGWLKA